MKKTNRLRLTVGLMTIMIMLSLNFQISYGLGISGPKTTSPNSTITVTVSGLSNIRGKFLVSVSNGTANKTSFFANGISSQSIQVKVGTSDKVKVTVSADTVSETATIDGTLIKTVLTHNVEIKQPSSGSSSGGSTGSSGGTTNGSSENNSSSQNNDTKSKDNLLSSLTISAGELSPAFDANKTSYNINVSGSINEVDISAKPKDSKAKVTGTGKKPLKVGENSYKIICTAENGLTKTYTLVFHVDETPLVYTKLGDTNLGVIRNLDGVKIPIGFKESSVKLDGKDIIGFNNEKLNLDIVYLINEAGEKKFFIVSEEKVVQPYQTITIDNKIYVVLDRLEFDEIKELKMGEVKIGDLEVSGWTFEDKKLSNYSLVYLMNDAGEKGLYSYESTEGTLQKYVSTAAISNNTLTYVFIGTTALFAITTAIAVGMYFNFKKKSISAIRDYYDSKNQGE